MILLNKFGPSLGVLTTTSADTEVYCTIVSDTRGRFTFSTRSELCSFYGASNSVVRAACRPNDLVLMQLLYTVCVPSLTYCAEVKELSSRDMNDCNVALNNAIRFIFSYNRWESTRHLRQELKYPNIYEIFHAFEMQSE